MIIPKSSILLLAIVLPVLCISAFTASVRLSSRSCFILSSSLDGNEQMINVPSVKVAKLDDDEMTSIATTMTEPTVISDAVVLNPRADMLKEELLRYAERLNRGFQATSNERDQVKDLIFQLAPLNPTTEPASPYYDGISNKSCEDSCTLSGKWTLIYTDAPDITGLDTSRNPLSTAQLGRIGQECSPPYIKNIIEWKRPEWARNLPFSGSDDSRVLQKVVTSASASPDKPRIVNLKVAGLELEAGSNDSTSSSTTTDLTSRIEKDGLIAGLLSANPVDLKGPLNPPFGQFEVLYLDEDLRIIKTYQNYLAVNRRIPKGEEWF